MLKTHKSLVHSGIKKYQCDICHKTFLEGHILSTHRLCHSRDKNFICDLCSKMFSCIVKHKLNHRGITILNIIFVTGHSLCEFGKT